MSSKNFALTLSPLVAGMAFMISIIIIDMLSPLLATPMPWQQILPTWTFPYTRYNSSEILNVDGYGAILCALVGIGVSHLILYSIYRTIYKREAKVNIVDTQGNFLRHE